MTLITKKQLDKKDAKAEVGKSLARLINKGIINYKK